jgi:UDP-N-acetylmuramate dehydrogenase
MNPKKNVSLAAYSTMGLGGPASYLAEVTTRMELLEALSWAQSQNVSVVMIGSGSNIIWRDEGFPGLVIVDKILGFELWNEDATNTYLTIGSGEPWDSVVDRSVTAGLTGIESLSLIPGTAGATPIQNVGAYGQEISNVLVTVQAFDTQAKDFVTIPASDCGFGYRMSRFNTIDRGRFYLTSLTLHLTVGNPQPPFYGALQTYLEACKISEFTPAVIRDAVIAIRSSKLPDPALVHNNGSFFSNPIISTEQYAYIAANYDSVPHWDAGSGSIKISAAWLIEAVGLKDFHDDQTGMSTWAKQPLILVNEHASSTADVLAFKDKIVAAVQAKFNLVLEQEPELLP